MKTYLCLIFFGDINFPEKHCCATLSILVQLTVSSTTEHTERIAAFPLQQQLHERTNVLSYMNTAYLVTLTDVTATHTIFRLFFLRRCDPTRVMDSSFLRFLNHTKLRTTVGRTPLDERSARRRDLYLTTHNTHNRQISMPPVEFKPTISAGERPHTYAFDRAATGTGQTCILQYRNPPTQKFSEKLLYLRVYKPWVEE
jgi:hypothetical protein